MIKTHLFLTELKAKIFIYFNVLTENVVFSQISGTFVLLINSFQNFALIFHIAYLQTNSMNNLGHILEEIMNIFIPLHLSIETSVNLIFTFIYQKSSPFGTCLEKHQMPHE